MRESANHVEAQRTGTLTAAVVIPCRDFELGSHWKPGPWSLAALRAHYGDTPDDGTWTAASRTDYYIERHFGQVLYGNGGEQSPGYCRWYQDEMHSPRPSAKSDAPTVEILAVEKLTRQKNSDNKAPRADLVIHLRINGAHESLVADELHHAETARIQGIATPVQDAILGVAVELNLRMEIRDHSMVSIAFREEKNPRPGQIIVLSHFIPGRGTSQLPTNDGLGITAQTVHGGLSVSVQSLSISFVATSEAGNRTDARRHDAALIHSVYLDAILLALVQRDALRALQKALGIISRDAARLERKSYDSVLEKIDRLSTKLSEFDSELWTRQVQTGSFINNVFRAFQRAHQLDEMHQEVVASHARWQSWGSGKRQEATARANEWLNVLVAVLGPATVLFAAASIAPKSWDDSVVFWSALAVSAVSTAAILAIRMIRLKLN